ncbi:Digestive organ expansion factor [Cryptosporidium tyzzeri]|nr:Digestive organ expansion factor [Cryptosporidium tyzzeri]
MTLRSKRRSLKSKNGNSRPISTTSKKIRTDTRKFDSDSTLSDLDGEINGIISNSSDVYSKWMQFVRNDFQNNLKESSKEKETESNGTEEVTNSIDTHNGALEGNVETEITFTKKHGEYFAEYTNDGMQQIPEINCKVTAESKEKTEKEIVNLPGFSPFKLESSQMSDRIRDIQKLILETPKFRKGKLNLANFQMDSKFRQNWRKHVESFEILESHELDELNTFYGIVNGYIDVEYSNLKAITSPWAMSLCMLHISRHIYNSRQLVINNNSKLQEAIKDKVNSNIDNLGDDRFRDQGFNRCRVLILCPFKGVTKKLVDALVTILPHGKVLRGYDRFKEEFGLPDNSSANKEATNEGNEQIKKDQKAESVENQGKANVLESKLGRNDELYRYLFEGKDHDDEFKLGIQLTKSGMNLYSSFDNSDIIIASPLGIRRVMGMSEGGKGSDISFCSSIEVCLVFGADIIFMQNWDHILDVFKVMNKLPKKSLGNCDIRRVYQAFLDGNSKEFRQTIMISAYRIEDINSLFRNHTQNRRGFIRLWKPLEKIIGYMEKNLPLYIAPKLVEGIQQMFIKTGDTGTPEECLLNYFGSTLYPDILAALDGKTERVLIVLSNYVIYLRIRKYLLQQNAIFASCNESTSNASLSRNRFAFYKGELPILITTERFLFFRRYLLKGATKVIFCGPPIYPSIYLDCIQSINFSQGPDKSNPKSTAPLAVTLFHWQNSLALERIVGTSKCSNLIQNAKASKPVVFKIPK